MSSSKRTWVVGAIAQIVQGNDSERVQTAEMIVDLLMEEGLLNLGYGNNDVDKVVEQFKTTFGTTKVTKADRFAAHRMSEKYGAQAVCGIVQLLAANVTEKYAPVVGSITQLETKWVSVMNFLRNIKSDETIEV